MENIAFCTYSQSLNECSVKFPEDASRLHEHLHHFACVEAFCHWSYDNPKWVAQNHALCTHHFKLICLSSAQQGPSLEQSLMDFKILKLAEALNQNKARKQELFSPTASLVSQFVPSLIQDYLQEANCPLHLLASAGYSYTLAYVIDQLSTKQLLHLAQGPAKPLPTLVKQLPESLKASTSAYKVGESFLNLVVCYCKQASKIIAALNKHPGALPRLLLEEGKEKHSPIWHLCEQKDRYLLEKIFNCAPEVSKELLCRQRAAPLKTVMALGDFHSAKLIENHFPKLLFQDHPQEKVWPSRAPQTLLALFTCPHVHWLTSFHLLLLRFCIAKDPLAISRCIFRADHPLWIFEFIREEYSCLSFIRLLIDHYPKEMASYLRRRKNEREENFLHLCLKKHCHNLILLLAQKSPACFRSLLNAADSQGITPKALMGKELWKQCSGPKDANEGIKKHSIEKSDPLITTSASEPHQEPFSDCEELVPLLFCTHDHPLYRSTKPL